MAKVLPVACFKSNKKTLTDEHEKQIQQMLLQLAKIEHEWYLSKKMITTDCQNGNRQDIVNS
jgi:hypothetical protein